uniref:Uncharacterized protein n=1 Tax=Arion vulgaris TaxID=1028688 RepID=A0A0B7AIG0_9EUPU
MKKFCCKNKVIETEMALTGESRTTRQHAECLPKLSRVEAVPSEQSAEESWRLGQEYYLTLDG